MKLFRHWFQDLNENKRRAFHFRGSVYLRQDHRRLVHYEVYSGPSFGINVTHGSHGEYETSVRLGLLFFTLYLCFKLPACLYFKRKCVATWDDNKEFYLIDDREYGVRFYDFSLIWCWHNKPMESSSRDPKWMRFRFNFLDFFFGHHETLTMEVASSENVGFKIGGKNFLMNSIKWARRESFRRHIPMSIYSNVWYSVDMKIKDPPLRSGKGENSWDCCDDGSYGIYMPWKHQEPSWQNKREIERLAVQDYVEHVMNDAKRYGGSSSERGISASDEFEYIGIRPMDGAKYAQDAIQ